MVPCNHDHGPPTAVAQRHQPTERNVERFDRRNRTIEQVTRVQHEIDLFGCGDGDDLVDHGAVLVDPVVSPQSFADVPVGGVQRSHRTYTGAMAGRGTQRPETS